MEDRDRKADVGAGQGATERRRARILLVDDDERLRGALAALLRDEDHEVVVAGDGDEALALAAERGPIELLITDICMPGIDGLELMMALRDGQGDLPTLLISGAADEATIEAALDEPDTRFLSKPFGIDLLLDSVVEMIAGVQAPRWARRGGG